MYKHCSCKNIVHVKTDDICNDIAEDVEIKSATSTLDRPLPKEKNKKVIGLMKDEFGGQIMKEFVGLRTKTYSYFKDNNDEDKKEKNKKKNVTRRNLNFNIIKTV